MSSPSALRTDAPPSKLARGSSRTSRREPLSGSRKYTQRARATQSGRRTLPRQRHAERHVQRHILVKSEHARVCLQLCSAHELFLQPQSGPHSLQSRRHTHQHHVNNCKFKRHAMQQGAHTKSGRRSLIAFIPLPLAAFFSLFPFSFTSPIPVSR